MLAQLPIFYLATWGLAILLTLILLGRIIATTQYRVYPLFTIYLACNLLQTAVGAYLYQRYGFSATESYIGGWTAQGFVIIARALAAAGVCHQILGRFKGVWAMAWRLLVFCGVLVLCAALYFGRAGYNFAVMTLEIGFESFIATWVVGLFWFARYYEVPVSRAAGLLGLGLGLNSCVKILNDVVFEWFVKAYSTQWNYVASTAFLGVLTIWIWALWKPAAAPVYEPGLRTANVYQTLVPQINRRLQKLNEQLGQFWHTEPPRP